jgi:hypothetical protein
MLKLKQDPLLGAAKVLLVIMQIFAVFMIVLMAIAIGALLTGGQGELLAEIAKVGAPEISYWAINGVIALIAVLFFLGLLFVLQLNKIVLSVDEGDPFRPENARRLANMAWIVVAAELVALAGSFVAEQAAEFAQKSGSQVEFDFGFEGGGILLIVVLFILSRVFRQGAAMREELEATV